MVRRFFTGFLSIILIALIAWPFLPRRYEATASLIVRATDENGQIDLTQSLLQPLDENAIQSEIDTIASSTLASEVIKRLNLSEDPEFRNEPSGLASRVRSFISSHFPTIQTNVTPPTEVDILRNLQDHLSISRDRRSYTIRIGYWSVDGAKAAKMANTLAATYLEFQLQQKRAAFEALNNRLKSQILELAGREANTNVELQNMLEKTGLSDPTLLTSLERQIETLSTELGQIRAQKAKASALVAIATSGVVVAAIGQALPLSEFGTSITDARANNLSRTASTDEMGTDRIAQTDLSRITLEESLIRTEIANLQAERRKLAIVEPKIDTLKRGLAAIRTQLDAAREQLLTRLATANQSRPDAQILVEARPPTSPVFPNPLLVTLVSIFAATLSGLALTLPKLPPLRGNRAVNGSGQSDLAAGEPTDFRFFHG